MHIIKCVVKDSGPDISRLEFSLDQSLHNSMGTCRNDIIYNLIRFFFSEVKFNFYEQPKSNHGSLERNVSFVYSFPANIRQIKLKTIVGNRQKHVKTREL